MREAARAEAINRGDFNDLGEFTVEAYRTIYEQHENKENRKRISEIFNIQQRNDARFMSKVTTRYRPYCCALCIKLRWPEEMKMLQINRWLSYRRHKTCIPGYACTSCAHKTQKGTSIFRPPTDFGKIPPEVKELTLYQRAGLSSLEQTNALRRSDLSGGSKAGFHYISGRQNYFMRLQFKRTDTDIRKIHGLPWLSTVHNHHIIE